MAITLRGYMTIMPDTLKFRPSIAINKKTLIMDLIKLPIKTRGRRHPNNHTRIASTKITPPLKKETKRYSSLRIKFNSLPNTLVSKFLYYRLMTM